MLKKKRNLDIVFGFHEIEGDWNVIRDKIEKAVEDKSHKLNLDIALKLIEFKAAQKSRNEGKKKEYKEIIDTMFGFLKDNIIDDGYDKIFSEQVDAIFKKTLRGYQNMEEDSMIEKEENLMKELHILLYKATTNRKFLTSNNPVFVIFDRDFYRVNITDYIFSLH